MNKHIQLSQLLLSRVDNLSDIDDQAIARVVEELLPIIQQHGFTFETWVSVQLGLSKYSIQDCEACGQRFVNRDQNPAGLDPDYVPDSTPYAIMDGGTHEGRKLCEECLPITHRWGLCS